MFKFKSLTLSPRISRNLIVNAFLVMTLLFTSGCLVHPKHTKTFLRDTDQLHQYQDGDFIVYNVSGSYFSPTSTTTQTFSGTMEVKWSALTQTLNDPNTGNPVAVTTNILRETSTLNLNGFDPVTTVRYVSQDADGNVYLHAFDKDLTQSYWVNDAKVIDTTVPLNPVVIATSPLAINTTPTTTTFYLFDDCTATSGCQTYLGNQNETSTIESDNESVRTDVGVFKTFSVSFFNGNKLVENSNLNAFPIELDIRSSCGLGNTAFNGTSFVFPQIGIVAMSVTCTNAANAETYNYNYSFLRSGGSILLPPPS